MAAFHFAPTELSKQNLLQEGKAEKNIYITGNTAIDALQTTVRENYHHEQLDWASNGRLIMLTAHRRENLGEPLHHMFRAIKRIVDEFSGINVIYPIHMNPMVRQAANDILGNHERIRSIEPLDVLDFHNFLAKSYLILTDSGGIQEEAPSLGKPVLVMRDTTERPEGIKAGTLKLVGTKEETIYNEFKSLLTNTEEYNCVDFSLRVLNSRGKIYETFLNLLFNLDRKGYFKGVYIGIKDWIKKCVWGKIGDLSE